jgi:sodium transport system permease protein
MNTLSTSGGKSRMWTIFSKEFREIFRDKRTTFSVIISPLLITPALFGLLGTVIGKQERQARTETLQVGVVTSAPQATNPLLQGASNIVFQSATRAEAEARIKNRQLKAAIVLPDDMDARMQSGRTVPVILLVDAGSDSSRSASQRLRAFFAERGEKVVEQRLAASSLPPELAKPFKLEEQPISAGGTSAMMMLSMFLPYTLALAAFGGGIYAANDQVAGEKERGTLETLLVSPASRRDVVLGKFMAVVGVCLISSFLSVVGLMIPFFSGLKAFEWLTKGGVSLSPTAIGVILLVQLPLAVLFAGILLAISTFSRNQKEAQTYLAPMFVAVLLPAMMSMLLRGEAALSMALVPVLNATLVLKQALMGIIDPAFIALGFASSILYAALALMFATRLFHKESVLLKA